MSYEKLVSAFKTPEEINTHAKRWGGFNNAPPGFKEITVEQFAQSGFFTWCKEGLEFRQIYLTPEQQKDMLSPVPYGFSITMFYMNHDEHFAIGHDYWGKKVRYFTFADCYHDWKEISAKEAGKPAFNCYHYCKCTKCGASWEYDSSG
jgi:hypothetical protein